MLVFASINQQPLNSSYAALHTLALLPHCKTQLDVNQIHGRLITTGLIRNVSLTTKLILSFCSSPHASLVQFARCVFFSQHSLPPQFNQSDPFLWNALIKSYSHGDDPEQATALFSLMLQNGFSADKFSFSLVLKACARTELMKEGMQIHGMMSKFEMGSDVFLQNCLICLYLRCGYIKFARQVFDRMSHRDSVSFNSMIDGYVKCGMISSACELFEFMPVEVKSLVSWNTMISGYAQSSDGFNCAQELFDKMPERDLVTWNLMLHSCVKSGKMDTAYLLFNKMPVRDAISWANMINGYAKLGKIDVARALFDRMSERDSISCNCMMAGYVQNGYCEEALKLFFDMKTGGTLSPDATTLTVAVSAVSQLGRIDEGLAIHDYIKDKRFLLNRKLGVALIDMYSKCGSIESAMHIFENIENTNVDHWNAMIGGLAIHGQGGSAVELFMEMERHSIEPDDITFITVLNACAHAGLVKEGMICFEILRRVHKLDPKLQHYGCMVDVFGRAGRLEEALKFIQEMPIEPNDVVWRTLLSACKKHGNVDIGNLAARHLFGLDSRGSGAYVLLSNMYAGFGMWEDVRNVRKRMKEKELKKIPGCSWIELEGVIHEFFAGDKSYSQLEDEYIARERSGLEESTYSILLKNLG